LEQILLDSNGNQKSQVSPADVQGCVYHASLLLANELRKDDNCSSAAQTTSNLKANSTNKLNCHEQSTFVFDDAKQGTTTSRKRKRSHTDHAALDLEGDISDDEDSLSSLPSPKVLDVLVDTFCSVLHPWIPFLHLSRFKDQVADLESRPELRIIHHAIVAATMKHVAEDAVGMSRADMDRQVRFSKKVVLLNAMNSLTIENIQALIIIAFNNVCFLKNEDFSFMSLIVFRLEMARFPKLGQL
jgi:hypothetical protein